MLSINLYIKSEYQDRVLVDFIKPTFEGFVKDRQISNYIFKRFALDHSPHIRLLVFPTSETFEQVFRSVSHNFFFNSALFPKEENEEITNTVFLKYPQGHIEMEEEDSDLMQDAALFRIKDTSLKILERISKNTDDSDEISINATLVFLYAIGGYSPSKMIEIIDLLNAQFNFNEDGLMHLNQKIEQMIGANLSYFQQSFSHILSELYQFSAPESFPSYISKWKHSFQILDHQHNSSFLKKSEYFALFRNQIGLLDAQTYFINGLISMVLKSLSHLRSQKEL